MQFDKYLIELYEINFDPSTGNGLPASLTAVAIYDSGPTSYFYQKVGAAHTAWSLVKSEPSALVANTVEEIVCQMLLGKTEFPETKISLSNNAAPVNIGIELNPLVIHSIRFKISIFRRTDTENYTESGILEISYDSEASAWRNPVPVTNFDIGTGVTFSISGNQIQAGTSNFVGANHNCVLRVKEIERLNQ